MEVRAAVSTAALMKQASAATTATVTTMAVASSASTERKAASLTTADTRGSSVTATAVTASVTTTAKRISTGAPRLRLGALGVLALLLAVLAPLPPTAANLRRPKKAHPAVPPESWLTTTELIQRWGYPAESHTVRTADGYLLELHRVPGPRQRPPSATASAGRRPPARTPMLLMHGFGSSSECMVLRPNKVLALMLADADFDVWIGNFRGTYYGRRHVSLSIKDPKFWDFGWHENGVFDVRALVDYILAATGQPSLLYAGHSMGATAALVLLAEHPEYNAKVRAHFMLAPAVYFRHLRGTFKRVRNNMRWAYRGFAALRADLAPLGRPAPELCIRPNDPFTVLPVCWRFMSEAQGPFQATTNNTYMPVLLRHWPAGTSTGQLMHFVQLIIRRDGFFKYDFGPEKNIEKYGTVYPPAYNLTNVRSPSFIYYCKNDYQAHHKDVKQLASDLPGLAGLHMAPLERFNHLDIMYEELAGEYVYPRLIEQMTKYR